MDNQKLLAHSIPRPFIIGIKPIPNVQEKRQEMLAKYHAETIDIEDVEYEKADPACYLRATDPDVQLNSWDILCNWRVDYLMCIIIITKSFFVFYKKYVIFAVLRLFRALNFDSSKANCSSL